MKENIEQVAHFQKRFPTLVRDITLLESVIDDAGGVFTSEELGVIFTDEPYPQSPQTEKVIINLKGMKKIAHLMDIRLRSAGLGAMDTTAERKEVYERKSPQPI